MFGTLPTTRLDSPLRASFWGVAVLGTCAGAGLLVTLLGASSGFAQLLLGALLPLFAVVLVLMFRGTSKIGDLRVVNPFFIVSVYWVMLFTVEPILVALDRSNNVPYAQLISPTTMGELVFRAGILGVISYAAMTFGYLVSRRGSGALVGVSGTSVEKERRRTPVLVVVGLLAVGAFGLIAYGGRLSALLATPEDRSEIVRGTGMLYTLVLCFLVLPVIWMCLVRGRPNWKVYLPLSVASLAALAVFGGRAEVAEGAVAATFALLIFRRPPWRRAVGLATLLAVVVLVFSGFFFAVRLEKQSQNRGIRPEDTFSYFSFGLRHTLAPYDNLLGYFETIGRDSEGSRLQEMGRNLIAGFLPSSVVGNRPLDPSQVLFQRLYGSSEVVGTPFTLPGLLMYAGGWPVVVVGMFLFGAAMRLAYRYLLRNLERPVVVAAYSYFIARLFIIVWGVYVPAVRQLVQIELLIIIAMISSSFLGKRRRIAGPLLSPSGDQARTVSTTLVRT